MLTRWIMLALVVLVSTFNWPGSLRVLEMISSLRISIVTLATCPLAAVRVIQEPATVGSRPRILVRRFPSWAAWPLTLVLVPRAQVIVRIVVINGMYGMQVGWHHGPCQRRMWTRSCRRGSPCWSERSNDAMRQISAIVSTRAGTSSARRWPKDITLSSVYPNIGFIYNHKAASQLLPIQHPWLNHMVPGNVVAIYRSLHYLSERTFTCFTARYVVRPVANQRNRIEGSSGTTIHHVSGTVCALQELLARLRMRE